MNLPFWAFFRVSFVALAPLIVLQSAGLTEGLLVPFFVQANHW
jgi:hypothetical protein